MFKKFLFLPLLAALFLFSERPALFSEELLTYDDIHKVMNEMLKEHYGKKKMSDFFVQDSLKNYINQFDPDKAYLLEKEEKEFTNLSNSELTQILDQYKEGNYSEYEKLNHVIQKAIDRARKIRQELIKNSTVLFQKSTNHPKALENKEIESFSTRSFPSSLEALKKRIEDQMILFISMERQRYGDKSVLENKNKLLAFYNRALSHHENQYLFLNKEGNPLPPQEKQNLFVLHILKALSKSLDSHTAFFNSEEAFDMKVRLEKGFHGIGVVLQQEPQGIVISKLIKGGPAQKSGLIKAGDQIIKINGIDVENSPLDELVEKLRDQSHQRVSLLLQRKTDVGGVISEHTIPVTLKREFIPIDTGRVKETDEKFGNGIIGILTLNSFYQGEDGISSANDIKKAIKALDKKGHLEGLILDLRENGGGFLNQAVKVAGLFITNGIVVVSKYSNGEEHFYRDMDGKASYSGPLVILTSKATASAAEIVSQALQDYGVALIVGDKRTYGKGTIQTQTITDSHAMDHFKVTVGRYYTVSGKSPQITGVKADIVVPSQYIHEHIGEEYLQNPLPSAKIDPLYKDALIGINPDLRPWYLKYYMPTLQKKETTLSKFIPTLKEKSEARMAKNNAYQKALSKEENPMMYSKDASDPVPDFQLKEAVNILEDLITLEKESKYGPKVVSP